MPNRPTDVPGQVVTVERRTIVADGVVELTVAGHDGGSLPAWEPGAHEHVVSSRLHYAANLMAATLKSSWPWVRALLRSVYDQPDAAEVQAQCGRVLGAVAEKTRPPRSPTAAGVPDE